MSFIILLIPGTCSDLVQLEASINVLMSRRPPFIDSILLYQSLSFPYISLLSLLFPSPCLMPQIHHMIPGHDTLMSRSVIPGLDILQGAFMMLSTLKRRKSQFVLAGMDQMILKILETGARRRNGHILSCFLSSRLSRKIIIFFFST